MTTALQIHEEETHSNLVYFPTNEINYTGKKKDPVTGLYYFNQRYYDSEIGRFLTEDPAGQGINPYAYCGNNPMGYVDPDGEFFQFLIPIIQAAIIAGAAKVAVDFSINLVTGQSNSFESLGQSFVDGAKMGAVIFITGPYMKGINFGSEWWQKAAAEGVKYGANNVVMGMVDGEHMSLDNTWGKFTQGFGEGFVSSCASQYYKSQVGYEASGVPGGKADPTKYENGISASKGANNIFFPVGEDPGTWKDLLREGGFVSTGFNYIIPGLNSAAGLHDSYGDLGFNLFHWKNTVTSMAFSVVVSTAALKVPYGY